MSNNKRVKNKIKNSTNGNSRKFTVLFYCERSPVKIITIIIIIRVIIIILTNRMQFPK